MRACRHRRGQNAARMFDLFAAAQQAMLLVMALVFMGVGGLLLGYEIRRRVRGLRVMGTIVGVRETRPNNYRTVYEYSLPSGQGVEATSSYGSSSLRGRDTGRRVPLFTFADRPDQVSEAGVPIAGLFGGVFFAVGLWPLHAALTSWPVTPLTGIVLVAVIGYYAYRARGLLIPKGQRKSPREWLEERRTARETELASVPIRPVEEIVTTPAAQATVARNRRAMRLARPIFVIVGVALIALSVHLGRQLAQRESIGVQVTGTVVSLYERSDSDGSIYYPVVRFQESNGAEVRFKDRVGSNPPSYRVGDAVTVLYVRGEAASSAMVDRGRWNWLPTGLIALLGGVLTVVGIRSRSPQSPGGSESGEE
jgi:Protein of unknown function (DUF3592)